MKKKDIGGPSTPLRYAQDDILLAGEDVKGILTKHLFATGFIWQ
jgi:hypothetical protein